MITITTRSKHRQIIECIELDNSIMVFGAVVLSMMNRSNDLDTLKTNATRLFHLAAMRLEKYGKT